MHRIIQQAESAAKGFHHPLQPQTNPEYRQGPFDAGLDQVGHPKIGGPARTGGEKDHVPLLLVQDFKGEAGPQGHNLGPGLTDVIGQGMDKRVLMIHKKDFGHLSLRKGRNKGNPFRRFFP